MLYYGWILPNHAFFTKRLENRDLEVVLVENCSKLHCESFWYGQELPKCLAFVGMMNLLSFTDPKSSFPESARLVGKMLGHLVGVFSDPLGHPIVHMESKYDFCRII